MKLYVKDFNLKESIESGQFFRYEKIDDYYIVILKDRVVKIKQESNILLIDSSNNDDIEKIIINFFSLDIDFNNITNSINLDNKIKTIIESSKGYRILRMEKLETVISYIISANNSVENIKRCVNRLSDKYGTKVLFDNKEYSLFPNINQIKDISIDELIDMKLGFRAKYVKSIIENINSNKLNLESINNMSSYDALDYLMKEKGIGLKVASCILLFSYSRYDVFPIDVWVKKIMNELYNLEKEKDIKNFVEQNYKEYSGLIVQYLFNYKRNIK